MRVLGLNVDGAFDYNPNDIIGRTFCAYLTIEDYIDKYGKKRQRNNIDIWRSEPFGSNEQFNELSNILF